MAIKNLDKITNHNICREKGLEIISCNNRNRYLNKDSATREVAVVRIEGDMGIAEMNRKEYFNSLTDPIKKDECIRCKLNPQNYKENLALYCNK
ncbi:MAG: hypothetical protein ABIH79_02580 [archaeon]